jgi:chorismate mutase/prephenate dehydratase
MSGSLAIEKNVRVAFLGPPGTFAHIAARKKFGNSVEYRPARDLASVFEMVARGSADYGIVPCENSFGSGISLSLDLFTKHEAKICAEIYLSIRLSLLARTPLEDVRVVYSHPHAFQQCQSWLRNNLVASVDMIEVSSTTLAAEKASKTPRAAAVASAEAARRYGLDVIQSDIGDDANAFTRFFVLSRDFSGSSGTDRTSIVLAAEDRVGALHEILGTFRRHGLSLTKIESRMGPNRPRDAHFFIDFLGHCADPKVKRALRTVAQLSRFLTVLGSYPAES